MTEGEGAREKEREREREREVRGREGVGGLGVFVGLDQREIYNDMYSQLRYTRKGGMLQSKIHHNRGQNVFKVDQ